MDTIPTSMGYVNPKNLIDELTYRNYEANRGYGMTREALEIVYGRDLSAYEHRYTSEGSPQYCQKHAEKFNYGECFSCRVEAQLSPCLICSTLDELDCKGHCRSCEEATRDEFSGVAPEDREAL